MYGKIKEHLQKELQEIKEALDKDKYPEKYSRLLDELV